MTNELPMNATPSDEQASSTGDPGARRFKSEDAEAFLAASSAIRESKGSDAGRLAASTQTEAEQQRLIV
jgi:hypothetical protein